MTIHTEKGKLMALLTIKSLEEQLPGNNYKDQLLKIVNDRLIGK
jgi:hypothetical protein